MDIETVNYANYLQRKIFGGLDGLRFISIIAVVWHHSVGEIEYIKISNYGFLGVDLFFVISGFLIVTLLLREKRKDNAISLKKFYIRRTLRIFPLYYGFILGLTFLYFLLHKESEFGQRLIRDLPVYLLYLGNIAPVGMSIVWSLATEEQFYLIWPAIEKYLEKYITLILLLSIAVNQLINFQRDEIFSFLGMPELANMSVFQTTFTPILLGVTLAHILNNKVTFNRVKLAISGKHSALLYLISTIVICSLSPSDISGLPRLIIQITMMLLVASIVVNEKSSIIPILKFPPIVRIGVISYGVYLFHIMVITISKSILSYLDYQSNMLLFLVSFSLTIVVAELSYRLFETPFLKLKSKFSIVHQKHI